jgi:hypothetical protein
MAHPEAEFVDSRASNPLWQRFYRILWAGLTAFSLCIPYPTKRYVPSPNDGIFLSCRWSADDTVMHTKHWQPEPPVGKEVVEQLIKGIEAESALPKNDMMVK